MKPEAAPHDEVVTSAVAQIMREFGADDAFAAQLGELGAMIAEGAPGMVAGVRRAELLTHAEDGFGRPLLARGMSDAQRALFSSLLRGKLDQPALQELLCQWAGAVQPEEVVDRVRLDGLRLHELMREAVTTVFGVDPARCTRMLEIVERLAFMQMAVLAAVSERRARGAGGAIATGYPRFIEELGRQMQARREDGRSLAVLLVDCGIVARLDALFGYDRGGEARERIARRLRVAVLRAGDLLAELGRDEFAVLLSVIGGAGVAQLAAQKVLRTLDMPVSVGDTDLFARPAVGIALFPGHGEDAQALLLNAKHASQGARDSVERFALHGERPESPDTRALLHEARLRTAVDEGHFSLAFQPQFDPRSRRIVGIESLLRWRDPDLGVVPPGRALQIAESAGLLNELTWWVVSSALRQQAAFRERGLDLTLSINVSPSTLCEPDLADYVDRALRTWGVPAERLILEITETAMVTASDSVAETLQRLKATGVRLSIDDFGTGYSSMYYLATLPLDEIKIDLSFVRDMLQVPQHERIVRSIIDLAHNLSLTVVAEGVEDAAVWERLAELDCDRIQGYFASRPLEPDELLERFAPPRP